jgi:hypothetical protein
MTLLRQGSGGEAHGLITRDFADGTYSFRLAYGQWLELQEAVNAGPLELYVNLLQRKWRIQNIREIVRIGLIGGGATPADAIRLVRRYVEERPLMENVQLAIEIVAASLELPKGVEAPAGEAEAAKTDSEGSTSPPSMETLQ